MNKQEVLSHGVAGKIQLYRLTGQDYGQLPFVQDLALQFYIAFQSILEEMSTVI